MRSLCRRTILLSACAIAVSGSAARAQPPGPPPGAGPGAGWGPGHGGGPGMMGGVPGRMGWGFQGPAGYLDALKTRLGITAAQSDAWKAYADTVTTQADEMRAQHRALMYEAMGTADWDERRAMMNRMFETREAAQEKVAQAANTLLGALTQQQRAQAQNLLPGLAPQGRGRGMGGPMMMGR